MSKFEEKLETYTKQIGEKLSGHTVDADLLRKVTKGCGPSIYNADSSQVSCSDQTELDRVKNNFLKKKHGLTDDAKCDAAIKEVCEEYNARPRYRAIFYYLLTQKLGLEGNY